MRIVIAAVGRLKGAAERDLVERYTGRVEALARQVRLGPVAVRELAESRAATAELRRRDEAARLAQGVREAAPRLALDERGKALSSRAFADLLARHRDAGAAEIAFVIGGPDGLDPSLLATAGAVLSLGAMTLPHGLARVVLAEQIYRAATLLAGHPYHRE